MSPPRRGPAAPRAGDSRHHLGQGVWKVLAAKGWWGDYVAPFGGENYYTAVLRKESKIGRKYDIVHAYHVDDQAFPTAHERQMAEEGRTLLINWKPSTSSWRSVAQGAVDARIDAAADRMKAFGKPLFLILHHEPENDLGTVGTPAEYVAMWRHVASRFRARGVTNVVSGR